VNFEMSEARLRSRRNNKWRKFAPDVLACWVADMDFSVAPAINEAVERLVANNDLGYPYRPGEGDGELAAAFASRMRERFGWKVETGLVQPVTELVQASWAVLMAFSDPGDGVVLQLPAYPPFGRAIDATGRRLIVQRLRDDGIRFQLDLDELAGLIDARTRVLLLCNPQNPTGRVFRREELEGIGRLAIAHDLVILSDEIHADLVYDGLQHIPIASISQEIAARTVTITSATKSFNIPGLRCGVMYFGSGALRERFHARIPSRLLGTPGITGMDGTVAAWTCSQPWLDAVVHHLHAMRERVAAFLAAELPEIGFHAPEATYLAWLDCSALKLNGTAFDFFHEHARIGFSPGQDFDPTCGSFVRFNFATSAEILDQILDRMAGAVRRNR
jgi:cystathionine beta-lyase